MNWANHTMPRLHLASWVRNNSQHHFHPSFSPLKPLRQWLNQIQVKDPKTARLLCSLIPTQCPFERDIKLGDRTIFHIPALCKLNPVYEELIGLRFRALCYLADECGEDITPYMGG